MDTQESIDVLSELPLPLAKFVYFGDDNGAAGMTVRRTWSDEDCFSIAIGRSMQTDMKRIGTRPRSKQSIASCRWKPSAIVVFSLFVCNTATAENKYITQPTRTTKQIRATVKASITEKALVEQAPGTPSALIASMPKMPHEVGQPQRPIESPGPAVTTWVSTGQQLGNNRNEPAVNGSLARPHLQIIAEPQSVDKPALNWVRRQQPGTHLSEPARNERTEIPPLEFSPQEGQQSANAQYSPAQSHSPAQSQFPSPTHRQPNFQEQIFPQPANAISAQLTAGSSPPNLHEEPRIRMASKISKQIMGDQDQQGQQPVRQVSLALGWASVGRQLAVHLRQSEHLAARGVFLSSREESQLALLLLVRYLDHLSNSFESEPGLHAAQTALRESADFTEFLLTADEGVLRQIVHSHETPLLKKSQLSQVSPLTLAEHYRRYAEGQIIEASQNHPWFSDVLYQVGRTYQAEAELANNSNADHLRGLALVYYRAALAIVPTNALASNQIGFVLLQQDRPLEAQQFFVASVDAKLNVPALQNLVEASRRLRDMPMEQWAMNTLTAIRSGQPADEPMPIQVVDNATFATLSPPSAGPKAPPQSTQSSVSPVATHNIPGAPTVNR